MGGSVILPIARRARYRPRAQTVDFRRLVGEAAWRELPPAVRRRFGHAAHRTAVSYRGAMEVRASAAGFLIAQALRILGTPLAPWRGEDVAVRVDVSLGRRGELVWARTYGFAGHAPVLVSSAKVVDAGGQLMEMIRGGLGMKLQVCVEQGALHFRSLGYFLSLGPVKLPLPALLTPGRAHVVHEDRGGGAFAFTLSFVHPWLGETFFQTGLFHDPQGWAP